MSATKRCSASSIWRPSGANLPLSESERLRVMFTAASSARRNGSQTSQLNYTRLRVPSAARRRSIRHFGDPAADHGLTVACAGLVGEDATSLPLSGGPHPGGDRFARAHRTRKSHAQPFETGGVALAEIVDHDFRGESHGAKSVHDESGQPRHSCHIFIDVNRIAIARSFRVTERLIRVDALSDS